jgi:hypothetical protein
MNKKNKCDTISDYQCNICKKYFKSSYYLSDHTKYKKCKTTNKDSIIISNPVNNNSEDIKIAIKSILISKTDDQTKIGLLNKYNILLTSEELTNIINLDMNIDGKVSYINSLIDIKNVIGTAKTNITNNINTGTITTTNNIQINNFRNENIEYLNNEYFKDLLMNNHIETAYMKLTEDIYLNEDHPENLTIKVDNLNNKFAFIYEDGKWKGILKYELKNILHDTNSRLLKVHYRKLKDLLDTAKKNSINVFLARQYDSDPHLKDMNEKMVLLFYEGKPKNENNV